MEEGTGGNGKRPRMTAKERQQERFDFLDYVKQLEAVVAGLRRVHAAQDQEEFALAWREMLDALEVLDEDHNEERIGG